MIHGYSRINLLALLGLSSILGCGSGEMEKLKAENDALKKKLAEYESTANAASSNKSNSTLSADTYEKVEFDDLLALPNKYMGKSVQVRLKGRAQIGGDAPKGHFFLNFIHKYATGIYVPEALYGKLKPCADKNIDLSIKANVVTDGAEQLALAVVTVDKLSCH